MLVNKATMRQNKWTKSKRIVVVAILLVILFVACKLIGKALVPRSSESKEVLHSYNISGNSSYAVNLIDNDFIEYSQMGMNQMYIAKLIKDIPVQFYYTYDASKPLDLSYTYYITATLSALTQSVSVDEVNQIWSKEYVLKAPVTKEIPNSQLISIQEQLIIDFTKYNSLINEFIKSLSIPITATLDIKLNVNVLGTVDADNSINENTIISTSIPLNTQVFKISRTDNFTNPYSITKVNVSEEKIPMYDLVYGIILLVLSFAVFLIYCKKIIGIPARTEYEKVMRKTLKEYGDIIIEVKALTDVSKFNVIDVKSFNEMLDLEQELRIPIMMYEIATDGPCWFTIVHNDLLYRYVYENPDYVKDGNINIEAETYNSPHINPTATPIIEPTIPVPLEATTDNKQANNIDMI